MLIEPAPRWLHEVKVNTFRNSTVAASRFNLRDVVLDDSRHMG
jgi:hypothetical protein